MKKFPSIEQFRNVIRAVTDRTRYVSGGGDEEVVFDHTRPLPTLSFRGTVKLHGTNAGIVWDGATDNLTFQSRERVLAETADNAGFWKWGQENYKYIQDMLANIAIGHVHPERLKETTVAVYGEWCGKGIQSGVAISQLEKMFVIFAVNVNDVWLDLDSISASLIPDADLKDRHQIFSITEFPSWEIDIDFEKPHLAQNDLAELTLKVEEKCPVGASFGVEGVGEGIVWIPTDPAWNDSRFWFKVKGEKHSVSKVKTLAPVDVVQIAKLEAFVDYAVTDNRLEQGLNNLLNEQQKPFEMQSLGDFIRWVVNDILKEEMDTITENGFDPKKLGGPISNKARKWYITRMNSGAT